jgi:hypothetical protein
MTVTSPKVFVRFLVFGLLLGAASTANADAISIISVNISNIQFTPAAGTATFTLMGASARAQAGNSLGENQDITSNTFPVAQSAVAVTFASASGIANATNTSVSGVAQANVSGCSCSAGSFSQSILTGTLVVLGGEGNVNVTISGLADGLTHLETDAFGEYVELGWLFDVTVNGVPVFSIDFINTRSGPNQLAVTQFSQQLSRVITVQYGAVNTIGIRLSPNALAINEVPEPATIALLISGLGFMTGVIRKRRKSASDRPH